MSPDELLAFLERGSSHVYRAGDYLFHESSPRLWLGIVQEGEVEIVRGMHGSSVPLATIHAGAAFSEGVMLDDLPHASSAVTRHGARVWQIPRDVLDELRRTRPEAFYRAVGRIARQLSARLANAGGRGAGEPQAVSAWRREHDLIGDRELPDHVYYGVQTLRGVENFPLSGLPLRRFEHFVRALALVKKAAAQANAELGVLEAGKGEAIVAACDEILAGKLHEHFVVDMIQGGAGTSTNMNANEVIANRALEILGHHKGEYQFLHPNDDVNCSQSTNDAYPTAIKLGVLLTLRDTLGALRELRTGLEAKGREFADVLKMGRTENQDAVPMTLGQEFGAYAVMISDGIRHLERAGDDATAAAFGCFLVGLRRAGMQLPVGGDLPLQKGDLAVAVGLPANLEALSLRLGRSERPGDEADLITFAFGIAAGIAVGLITVRIGGVPMGLGTAGGLLLSGLVIGFPRTLNPTFGQLSVGATSVLMELGLQFFMANVGLEAGGTILEALRAGGPWLPLGAGSLLMRL